jgi:hypothetical protein
MFVLEGTSAFGNAGCPLGRMQVAVQGYGSVQEWHGSCGNNSRRIRYTAVCYSAA